MFFSKVALSLSNFGSGKILNLDRMLGFLFIEAHISIFISQSLKNSTSSSLDQYRRDRTGLPDGYWNSVTEIISDGLLECALATLAVGSGRDESMSRRYLGSTIIFQIRTALISAVAKLSVSTV